MSPFGAQSPKRNPLPEERPSGRVSKDEDFRRRANALGALYWQTQDETLLKKPGAGARVAEPDTKQDTEDLDALLDSLNGSAERFQTLWFSFLGLTLYLAIAALATTHRNLLLGEPQTLPILNIKVDLLPFYVIAPLFYLVFHFYVLMMLLLLARTTAPFEKQLNVTLPREGGQERYRARVENALFLQILIGMKPERAGFNGVLLGMIALITIVLAPLATLILMQMMFLPYHHLTITWWHRRLVLADLVLIIVMWSRFFAYSGVENPQFFLFPQRGSLRAGLARAAYLVLVGVVMWLAVWEGRWAGEPYVGRPDVAATANGVVFGLFPDRLKLDSETVVGEKTLKETKEEIASRGGDFVPTIKLDGRDLQSVVLSGADLRGVSLNDALMQGADLSRARLDGARLVMARLQGADLNSAQLQGDHLFGARLQGASLGAANLQGANLRDAHLQGAALRDTQLEGVDLRDAQLQGADLKGAHMLEAEFDETFVFGADVTDADLATAAIRSARADNVFRDDEEKITTLTPPVLQKWIAAATEFASDERKPLITRRLAWLKPDSQEAADQPKWGGLTEASSALDPDGAQYRRRLADRLGDLACDADGAPYVARRTRSRSTNRPRRPIEPCARSHESRAGEAGLLQGRRRLHRGRLAPARCDQAGRGLMRRKR